MFIAGTAPIDNDGAIRSLIEVVPHARPTGRIMIRRNTLLLLLSLLVGPGIGGIVCLVLMMLTDPKGTALIGSYWPMALFGGYVLGAVPGLLSGIGMVILSNFIDSPALRLIASAMLGAVLSVVCITLMVGNGGKSPPEFTMLAVIAATGAISAFACMAIVEACRPLPPLEAAS